MNVTKGGIIETNAPDFATGQLQPMGEIKTLKEDKDRTLTMPTKEEVVAEEGVEQQEPMEMDVVDMPTTMQVQPLQMKQTIVEEFMRQLITLEREINTR